MPSLPRTNRFQPTTTTTRTSRSLHRLRTAFSPSSRSRSPSTSTTTSPLSRNSSPASYRTSSSITSIRHMLRVRRQPSELEFEMEEEKHLFGREMELLEPRPGCGGEEGGRVVGIFEVLDGKF